MNSEKKEEIPQPKFKKITNMNTITGQDILYLKRFMEKGFRTKLFENEDMNSALNVREKLKIIIENIMMNDD